MKVNFRIWLPKWQSPDNVARFLILDDKVDDVLSNASINLLDDYISKFNKEYPENQVSMLDVLTRRYGESSVSKMLEVSKSVAGRNELASKLQSAQIKGWLDEGKSPGDVIKIVMRDNWSDNLLARQNVDVVRKYISEFNKLRDVGQQTPMFQAITGVYRRDEDIAKKLFGATYGGYGIDEVIDGVQAALFTKWLTEGKSKQGVKEVFRLDAYRAYRNPVASAVLDDYGILRGGQAGAKCGKVKNKFVEEVLALFPSP